MKSNVLKSEAEFRVEGGPIFRQGATDAVWSITPISATAAHRFGQLVNDLPKALPNLKPMVGVFLCAIAYDCILTEKDLIAYTTAAMDAKSERVTWVSNQQGHAYLDARCMSLRTQLCRTAVTDRVDCRAGLEELHHYLKRTYKLQGINGHPSSVLHQVLADARAWWCVHLPLCLYSHIQGAGRMPLLDDNVFQRLHDSSSRAPTATTPADAALNEAVDHTLDVALISAANDTPVPPKQTISLIQSLFTVNTASTGIRLANYLNKRELIDKLSLCVSQTKRDGWIGAVLLSWAMHLLTVGSVRKQNPAVSTLAAYVNALLEPLAHSLCKLKYSPAVYDQGEWERLFDELIKQQPTGQHAAALASLHHWAVHTYGCTPLSDVMFQTSAPTRVHANLVWPHEKQRALNSAASISSDERVNHHVQLMLAFGAGGLFRAGEIASLTTDDLKENGDFLEVHLNPGRGIHGGKSRAARRIVRMHDKAAIALILKWRDRRNWESDFTSSGKVFLFGDPHNPGQLYKVGHSMRLVNDLLKLVTGDDQVSFHSLRHANATQRAYSLLTTLQAPYAVNPLDELCHEMGHATYNTLWSTYFHLPEFAMREAIDRISIVAHYSAEETSYWLPITAAALRQRALRSVREDAVPADLYRQYLEHQVRSRFVPLTPEQWGALERPPSPTPSVEYAWQLPAITQALSAICQASSIEVACHRLSCTPPQLQTVCLEIQSTVRSLSYVGRLMKSDWLLDTATPAHAFQWAQEQLRNLGWTYSARGNALVKMLYRYMEAQSHRTTVSQAAQAWARMLKKHTLSLHDPAATQALLFFLKQARYPCNAIVVRVQSSSVDLDAAAPATLIKDIQSIAHEIYASSLRVEAVKPRRGTPDQYVLLARTAVKPGSVAPSAAVRMREFHGLMFAFCVFQSLQRSKGLA